MKRQKFLVVIHDEPTRQAIDEILSTMGHKYEFASSLAEAREAIARDGFTLVLLDHEIAARPGGNPRAQYTEYVMRELRLIKGDDMPPVVIIANRLPDVDDEDKFRWAADMRSRGATTFVLRPLRTRGRTLERVIDKILAGQTESIRMRGGLCALASAPAGGEPAAPTGTSSPNDGGRHPHLLRPRTRRSPRRRGTYGCRSPTSPSNSTTSWRSSASPAAERTACAESVPCWLRLATGP